MTQLVYVHCILPAILSHLNHKLCRAAASIYRQVHGANERQTKQSTITYGNNQWTLIADIQTALSEEQQLTIASLSLIVEQKSHSHDDIMFTGWCLAARIKVSDLACLCTVRVASGLCFCQV